MPHKDWSESLSGPLQQLFSPKGGIEGLLPIRLVIQPICG
jgi:hypothetical protein